MSYDESPPINNIMPTTIEAIPMMDVAATGGQLIGDSTDETDSGVSKDEENVTEVNPCFYADSELCEMPRIIDTCKECFSHPTIANSLVCCNVTDIERAISCVPIPNTNSSYWVNLHIRNATVDKLDFSQNYWKQLESLAVTDGHINEIINDFAKFSQPQCINLSNNNITTIPPRVFKELTRLQVLDISQNNLSTIPNLNSIRTNLSLNIGYVIYIHIFNSIFFLIQ